MEILKKCAIMTIMLIGRREQKIVVCRTDAGAPKAPLCKGSWQKSLIFD